MATMSLDAAVTCLRVVQHGSFTAAARALGLPKSAVSRRVAQLEADLHVQLLHRTTRKLHLTEVGALYLDRVARAVAELEGAHALVDELKEAPRGVLRVTAPIDFAIVHLAPMVAAFTERYPEVRVELELTARVVDLVDEGFDVAFRAGRLPDS